MPPSGETSSKFPFFDDKEEEGSRTAFLRPSSTDIVDSRPAAAEATKELSHAASPLPSADDAKFSWLGHRPLGAAAVARMGGNDVSGGFLRSGVLNTTTKNDVGATSSLSSLSRAAEAAAAALVLSPHRPERQGAGRPLLVSFAREQQRARIATALDRMGAGVIEVREAFQRWVPGAHRIPGIGTTSLERGHKRQQARSGGRGPSVSAESLVGSGKLGVSLPDPAKVDLPEPASSTGAVDLNEGVLRAMQELRLPLEIAAAFCKEAAGGAEAVPAKEMLFSEFVSRYADAAGLLAESLARDREGGAVWVEGPGGRWVAVSRAESEGVRRVFDEQAGAQGGQETKLDDGGMW